VPIQARDEFNSGAELGPASRQAGQELRV